MALISVAELKEHISFLRAVHTESSHGDESLYADSKRLRAAVRAYLTWLAARVAAAPFGGTALVTCPPPLDIAWVWHVHRLAPREYARACAALGACCRGGAHAVASAPRVLRPLRKEQELSTAARDLLAGLMHKDMLTRLSLAHVRAHAWLREPDDGGDGDAGESKVDVAVAAPGPVGDEDVRPGLRTSL